jgi:hypothetical protein
MLRCAFRHAQGTKVDSRQGHSMLQSGPELASVMLEPCEEANWFVPVISFTDQSSTGTKTVRGSQSNLTLASWARDTVRFEFTGFKLGYDGTLLDCTLRSPDISPDFSSTGAELTLFFEARLARRNDTEQAGDPSRGKLSSALDWLLDVQALKCCVLLRLTA